LFPQWELQGGKTELKTGDMSEGESALGVAPGEREGSGKTEDYMVEKKKRRGGRKKRKRTGGGFAGVSKGKRNRCGRKR